MPKVIALCGKICSGKTRLARRMAEEEPAVIFSCDEVMADLFHHDLPDFDRTADELKAFLLKKAAETVRAGATVILDWGFWSRRERAETDAFFRERGILCEWHGVELSEADHRRAISCRNRAVASGESTDFSVDQGLLDKMNSRYEAPEPGEMDFVHRMSWDRKL